MYIQVVKCLLKDTNIVATYLLVISNGLYDVIVFD